MIYILILLFVILVGFAVMNNFDVKPDDWDYGDFFVPAMLLAAIIYLA
jgi:hypothetical protein